MSSKFMGTGVAMVTPFLSNKQIDFKGLEKLTEYLITNGINYLVVLGTTGETPTLNRQERHQILDFVVKIANQRVPIVAGFGGNNTNDLIAEIDAYHFRGIDGILSASPNYNKPSQEGIYQHFKTLAKYATVPIILYNVPSRTGSNMLAETTLRLANDFSNIVAIKEASGNIGQCMDILARKKADFSLISGDDALALPLIACGAKGVVSVIGNAFAKPFSDMVQNALHSNFALAQPLHYQLLHMISLLFEDGNPGGIKAVLQQMNICERHVRLPLVDVNKKTQQKIETEVNKLLQLTQEVA